MNATDTGVGGAPTGRMSEAPTVSRETFVKDFRERMKDRLPDETIDAAAETMTAATTSYMALMIPISVIFYSRVQVLIDDSKALSSPSSGATPAAWSCPAPPFFRRLRRCRDYG